MAIEFTLGQSQAIRTSDKDICVVAGAGSGKTLVLVEKFYELVRKRDYPVNRILAMTFTEKATSEMKERIAERFAKEGLYSLRQEIEFAYISTIHGFCSRVLRENAIEAGVDPQFQVLEELEAARLKEVVLAELVNEWIEQEPERLSHIINDVKFETQLHAINKEFYENILNIYAKIRVSGRTFEEALETSDVSLEDAKNGVVAAYGSIELADNEVRTLPEKSRQRYETALAYKQSVLNLGSSSITQDKLVELKAFLKQIGGSLAKVLKEPFDNLKSAINTLVAACIDILTTKARKQLEELLVAFDIRFSQVKSASGMLDYDDLQLKATELLEHNPDIRKKLQDWFEYILIDEFQDVSFIQKLLIEQLARPGRLFVVGDAKQSIYTWRDADLDVFFDYQKLIRKHPKGSQIIELNKNFRSRPEILSFVNFLFGEVWDSQEDNLLGLKDLQAGLDFDTKDVPSVDLLLVRVDNLPSGRATEADFLAGKIKDVVENKRLKITDRSSTDYDEPISYKDIVMLLRSTSDIKTYENAFNNYDIPYYIVVGRGFYNAREIVDLTNLLKVLDNPFDEIVLASVLKSPFVAIDDQTLFSLCNASHSKGLRLYDVVREAQFPDDIDIQQRESLSEFSRVLNRLQMMKGTISIEALINEVFALTDFPIKVLLQSNGRRRFANLRQILKFAREFDSSGVFGLKDFIQIIEEYRFKQVRQSEAPIESEKDDVVKIMTIHQAKGLEFPVVIIPDISRKLQNTSANILFSRQQGVGFKYNFPEDEELEKSLSYAQVKEKLNKNERSEFSRLLYVATTRAKEHLILTGVVKYK
ncbi:MAG: UvrD-helicase domain-containing protein, partial [Armatimonadetes bacterium]|nr:UvrD-helicase domain-containing protein [Armatimonadota bacterium]